MRQKFLEEYDIQSQNQPIYDLCEAIYQKKLDIRANQIDTIYANFI